MLWYALKIYRTIVIEGWQDIEESEEQCVMNDSTVLSLGFNSLSLECSYEL